jgi:hypothetical protein
MTFTFFVIIEIFCVSHRIIAEFILDYVKYMLLAVELPSITISVLDFLYYMFIYRV